MLSPVLGFTCHWCGHELAIEEERAALQCGRCGAAALAGVLELTHWYGRLRVAEERLAFAGSAVIGFEMAVDGEAPRQSLGAIWLRCRPCGARSVAPAMMFTRYPDEPEAFACQACGARAPATVVAEFFETLTHCVAAADQFADTFGWRPRPPWPAAFDTRSRSRG